MSSPMVMPNSRGRTLPGAKVFSLRTFVASISLTETGPPLAGRAGLFRPTASFAVSKAGTAWQDTLDRTIPVGRRSP